VGCKYFIDFIPLNELGLWQPILKKNWWNFFKTGWNRKKSWYSTKEIVRFYGWSIFS
jgi:hypothetical protein